MISAPKSEKTKEEQVSVDSLVHYLQRKCGCQEVQWQEEPKDPPDFWITISGKKYAVEVTSITL